MQGLFYCDFKAVLPSVKAGPVVGRGHAIIPVTEWAQHGSAGRPATSTSQSKTDVDETNLSAESSCIIP